MRFVVIFIGFVIFVLGMVMLTLPSQAHFIFLSWVPFLLSHRIILGCFGLVLGIIILLSYCKGKLCFLVRLTGFLAVIKGALAMLSPRYYVEQLLIWWLKLPNYLYCWFGLFAVLLGLVLIYSQRRIKIEELDEPTQP